MADCSFSPRLSRAPRGTASPSPQRSGCGGGGSSPRAFGEQAMADELVSAQVAQIERLRVIQRRIDAARGNASKELRLALNESALSVQRFTQSRKGQVALNESALSVQRFTQSRKGQ